MGTLLKLALRNLFRFKRRTFITMSATSLGLALLIISISLMNGIDKQSISNIIHSQTSHLKVFKKGYFKDKDELPMNLTIKDPDRFRTTILGTSRVKAMESRILFPAGLIKGMDELPCLGVAIEPERDPSLLNIKDSLIKGEWLEKKDTGVLVGEDLAQDVGLDIGDTITLRMISSTEEEDFSWNAVDAEVKGIFNSGNPTVDSGRIFISMDLAQQSLSLEGEVTELVICLDSDDDKVVDQARKEIQAKVSMLQQDLEVYTWKDLAGVFLTISEMKTRNSAMIILIILGIASLGIVNTMLMTVLERTREIGMMAAMGMKKREIMQLFIYEGGFIGAMGAFLGCIIGGALALYLEKVGFSIDALGDTYEDLAAAVYPVKDVFYGDFSWGVLLMVFLFGTAVAAIASYYPARKAARMKPVDALRHI